MPILQDDEDLTWRDLFRRLQQAFPSLAGMIAAASNWRAQRNKMRSLYDRLDNNAAGRFNKRNYIKQVNQIRKMRK